MTTQSAGSPAAMATAVALRPSAPADAELSRLDQLLDSLAEVQSAIGALEGRRAVLLAEVSQVAERAEARLVDDDGATVRATSSRRQELARRAVVVEVATVLHVGEHAAGTLCDHAGALRAKAPRTLALLSAGRCSWAHASRVARHVADLDDGDARRVEEAVTPVLVTSTPGQVDARARRAREDIHPEPVEVRHARAAAARSVHLDDARDGMAWLSAHLPAVVAHAAYDRLARTATSLRRENTSLSRGHGIADAFAALLLDDGTLDRTCVPTVPEQHVPAQAPSAQPSAMSSPTLSAQPSAMHPSSAQPSSAATSSMPSVAMPSVAMSSVSMSSTSAASTIPSLAALARSIRPRVTVTVPVLTLLGAAEIPAELDGYGPVGPDVARELAELAPSLRRVLTHPETGIALSVGRESYTVPSALRAALARRDATCRFPGCGVAADRADLDHTTDWAEGGTTGADNLSHLCRKHHVLKHQTRWSVRRAGPRAAGGSAGDDSTGDPPGLGGTLEWTSPTGRRYVTRPDGRPPASIHRELPEPAVPPDTDSADLPELERRVPGSAPPPVYGEPPF